MDLRTYQAYSMAQALAAVKHDLGPDAVILNTRTYRRGGLLGIGRRTVIELTATTGAGRSKGAPRPSVRGAKAAALAYGAKPTAAEPAVDPEFDRRKTRRLAQALQVQHERKQREQAAPAPPAVAPPPPAGPVPLPVPAAAEAPASAGRTPAPRRFILTPADAPARGDERRPPGANPPRHRAAPREAAAPAPAPSTAVQDELSAIRRMVGTVLQQQVGRRGVAGVAAMPQQLFEVYLKLVGQEMSEELADQVVNAVRDDLDESALEDEAAVRKAVRAHLAGFVPVAHEALPERSPDGRPLTIALVGPTGVGKTTTLAKLAASFKLKHGRTVGLVTADTYRIAAVDQLRTYADIIGLRLEVVLTPEEMRRAVSALDECDVILIDTAGRSQNDSGRIDELKAFIGAAEPHEVHLVLSSTAGERVLLREAEAFGRVGVDKVVLTKLDEAVSFGMLVDVIRRIGKELSFMTNGQEVPDHIEVVRPDRLAGLVLGEETSA